MYFKISQGKPHHIETGTANPVRLPPYRLPHAYQEGDAGARDH